MIKKGAIAPLIAMSNSSDSETQRCISCTIANLATKGSNQSLILNERGLRSIISLASSSDATQFVSYEQTQNIRLDFLPQLHFSCESQIF